MRKVDLTAQTFGGLTAIKIVARRGRHLLWECRCECGQMVSVSTTHLRSGHTKSCGCYRAKKDALLRESKRNAAYQTGKLCRTCGEVKAVDMFSKCHSSPTGLAGACRDCNKARMRLYRQIAPERARASHYKYNEANRKRVNDSCRQYRAANPEKTKLWASRSGYKRRAQLANAKCDFTREQWEQIKAFYNYRCAFCGEKKPLTQDHILAVSKGGDHTASNILPLCQICNSSKGNREVKKTFQPHLLMAV